jgi:SSS family solute:Na+ symporter
MDTWVISTSIILVYVVLVGVLSVVAFRRLRVNIEDYFLVSRLAGFFVLYLTIVATYHSAYAILTSCGTFYGTGIFFWDAGTWTFITGLCSYILGYRFWILGKKYGYMTPSDLLSDFYDSRFLGFLVAVIMAVFLIPYIVVQAMGLGYIISVASEGVIPYTYGMIALSLFTAAYCLVGGLRAVYWTDVFQGIWMFVALWIAGLFLAFTVFKGGIAEVFSILAAEKPALLTINVPYTYWLSMTFVFSFGIVLQPHLWVRYYTARDPKTLKWLGATTPIYLMFIYVPAALVGFTAAAAVVKGLMPEIVKTYGTVDATLPAMLVKFAPPWFTGILLAGAAAAAMSTMDSQFHAFSLVLTRDIYQKINPKASDIALIRVGRVFIAIAFILSAWLALYRPGIIFDIVAFAGAGTLQLLPATIGAIYPTGRFRVTRTAAITGIIIGSIIVIITEFTGRLGLPAWLYRPYGFHGGMIAFLINVVITLIISLFTKPPSPEKIEKFHKLLEEEIYKK